jgi:hypothetical protein
MIGRALRVLLVMVCTVGGAWGFAGGPHATAHQFVGATQPGHHHGSGGHAPQVIDEGTRTSTRRRVRATAARLLPKPLQAMWVALHSVARRCTGAVRRPQVWALRSRTASSPITLCVCRT